MSHPNVPVHPAVEADEFGRKKKHTMVEVTAPDIDPELLRQLQKCKIWAKIKSGELHTITRQNVDELLSALDTEDVGFVTTDALACLRYVPEANLTKSDIAKLVEDLKVEPGAVVEVEDLHRALLSGDLNFENFMKSFAATGVKRKTHEVPRAGLIGFLKAEHETTTALWSLPQTIAAFIAFMFCCLLHLDMYSAYLIETSTTNALAAWDDGYMGKFVHDIPTYWDWMQQSATNAMFNTNLGDFPFPGRLESYNQMIGGMQMMKTDIPKGDCDVSPVWNTIYSSQPDGSCNHGGEPVPESQFFFYDEDRGSIVEKLKALRMSNWVSLNTTVVDSQVLYYNAYLGAFVDFHIVLTWDEDQAQVDSGRKNGQVFLGFATETFPANPYHKWYTWIPDIIFVAFLAKFLYVALAQMIQALMSGKKGFAAYWDVWNVVEWTSMLLSLAVCCYWASICINIGQNLPPLYDALPMSTLDLEVVRTGAYLSSSRFDELTDRTDLETKLTDLHTLVLEISADHANLRILVFFNSAVMIMKFFKAFRANPRLNVVISTMQWAAIDVTHFVIVFLVAFFVFSQSAMVVFGPGMRDFREIIISMITSWRFILRVYGYVNTMEIPGVGFAWGWYVLINLFIGLILLNITIAIVMDAYASAKSNSKNLTIWTQMKDAVKSAQETRRFLNIWFLICRFNDVDDPAHPKPKVTARSLRRAFAHEQMSKANADYLIRKTQKFLERQLPPVTFKGTLHAISQIRTLVLKLAELSDAQYAIVLKQTDLDETHAKGFLDVIALGNKPRRPSKSKGESTLRRTGHAQDAVSNQGPVLPSEESPPSPLSPSPPLSHGPDIPRKDREGPDRIKNGKSAQFMSEAHHKAAPSDKQGTGTKVSEYSIKITHPNNPLITVSDEPPRRRRSKGFITEDPASLQFSLALQELSSSKDQEEFKALDQTMKEHLSQMMKISDELEKLQVASASTQKMWMLERESREKMNGLVESRIQSLEKGGEKAEKTFCKVLSLFKKNDFNVILDFPARVEETIEMETRRFEMNRPRGAVEPILEYFDTSRRTATDYEKILGALSEKLEILIGLAEEDHTANAMVARIEAEVKDTLGGSLSNSTPLRPTSTDLRSRQTPLMDAGAATLRSG